MESSVGKSVEDTYREFKAHLRYATFWKRFFASWIDGIIINVSIGILTLLLINVLNLSEDHSFVLLALLPFAYSIFMHGYMGQTIGKSFLNIEVLNNQGETKISYLQAFKRDAVPLFAYMVFIVLSYFPNTESPEPGTTMFVVTSFLAGSFFLWHVLEILTMLTNKKRRAIHDFIAGTVVVRT